MHIGKDVQFWWFRSHSSSRIYSHRDGHGFRNPVARNQIGRLKQFPTKSVWANLIHMPAKETSSVLDSKPWPPTQIHRTKKRAVVPHLSALLWCAVFLLPGRSCCPFLWVVGEVFFRPSPHCCLVLFTYSYNSVSELQFFPHLSSHLCPAFPFPLCLISLAEWARGREMLNRYGILNGFGAKRPLCARSPLSCCSILQFALKPCHTLMVRVNQCSTRW